LIDFVRFSYAWGALEPRVEEYVFCEPYKRSRLYETVCFTVRDLYAILTPDVLDFLMHLMLDEKRNAPKFLGEARLHAPINPGSRLLRRAIRKNIVSFPAQVPAFAKQPPDGAQWRMVLLYFVRGWNLRDIAARFQVPPHRVCLILNNWSVRALALGYVEIVDPDAFAECCRVDVEHGTGREAEETRLDESGPAVGIHHRQFPEAAPAMHVSATSVAAGMRSGGISNEVPVKSVKVIDALDVAIARCEEWGDEFWVRTATHLRDLRAIAATALETRPAVDQTDGRFTTFQGGKNNLKHDLSVIAEEQVSHAVA